MKQEISVDFFEGIYNTEKIHLVKKICCCMLLAGSIQFLSAQSWKLTGNSGLTASNFLGSTDSKDVIFKTTNTERGRLTAAGLWRLGTTTNFAQVDAAGKLSFGGTGVYQVASNQYVFQYATSPNYGLFFNSSVPQYEFRNGSASPVFSINANTGNGVFTGNLKVGNYTLPTTDGANGQVLKTNGAGMLIWSNDNNTIYNAGTGINISGNTITNTAPNVPVTLTGSGATTVTGAYPNFTISSTDNNTIYTPGTGINISGTTISNTAPDQLVTINGSGATTITGTYPNFNISSTIYTAGAGITISNDVINNIGDLDASDDANLSLSNLSGTAINQDLLPGSAGTKDIGSVSHPWKNLFLDSAVYLGGSRFIFSRNETNTGIGLNTLKYSAYEDLLDSLGNDNTAIGYNALSFNSSNSNTAIGSQALAYNHALGRADRSNNTACGYQALSANLAGINNTAMGSQALYTNIGDNNTANGFQALYTNRGGNNTAIGNEALYSNWFGGDNTAIGFQALYLNINGSGNVAVGSHALNNNTQVNNLVAIGDNALYNNTTGALNTAIGSQALYSNTDGNRNTATGYQSLHSNTSGYSNTVNGFNAGYSNTTGFQNSFFGGNAGLANADGYDNSFYGVDAGQANTSGHQNSFFGRAAGYSNVGGFDNSFYGRDAGYSNASGNNNVFSGTKAGYSNTTANDNTFVGYQSGYSNTTGDGNVAIGTGALYANTVGGGNVAIGSGALHENTTPNSNTAVGGTALRFNTIGILNTAFGNQAGFSNITGFSNTFIGYAADANAGGLINATALGYTATVTASNQIRIGNSSVNSIGGSVGWSVISDGRFKKNIKENIPGLAFIKLLRPVTYNLEIADLESYLTKDRSVAHDEKNSGPMLKHMDAIKEKEQIFYTGFVAQDVEKAAKKIGYDFSGVDAPKNDKDFYGLRYAEFVVPLVKAVQELSAMIDRKDDAIERLEKENNRLAARLDKIEAAMSHCCTAFQSPVSETEITITDIDKARLEQNIPNPFSRETYIQYYLPASIKQAQLLITDINGKKLKLQTISAGYGKVTIKAGELSSGTYTYTLYADGKIVDSKKMMLTK